MKDPYREAKILQFIMAGDYELGIKRHYYVMFNPQVGNNVHYKFNTAKEAEKFAGKHVYKRNIFFS